ncbi:hypothetical protein DCC62_07100 [candidate division KSB1 bacterium]|nr:DUF4160 domain-containing protein [candidate division KSB1 bacterium]RIK78633.1 MAG: hypothetical protein DCC62_07100 [candidate division KSB1 bacterium]
MPKLYEYFGLVVFFFANDHEPIHVHGRYQAAEMKAELIIENGKVVEIRIKHLKGKKPLPKSQLSDFRKLVASHADEIVQKWVDFFVMGKQIKSKTIKQKLK